MSFNQKRLRLNWSELNPELLELIISRLSYADLQSCKLVCSSWHAAAENVKFGPLLLLPCAEDEETISVGVFSLKDKETHDLGFVLEKSKDIHHILFEPEAIRFVGSSHGWMVVDDRLAKPCLCNLFSGKRFQLPGRSTLQELVNSRYNHDDFILQETLIQKAILTANPSSDESYKVIVIHNPCEKLAFCGKDDNRWTGFSESQAYYDLVWSEGMLYALRDGITIEGWDFSGGSCCPTRKMCIQCSFNTNLSFPIDRCITHWYIVPSMGVILVILRYIRYFVMNGDGELLCEGDLLDLHDCWYRTYKFEVFRLDMVAAKLEQVKSLKDEVIFIGGNHGISLPAKDCQECKRIRFISLMTIGLGCMKVTALVVMILECSV